MGKTKANGPNKPQTPAEMPVEYASAIDKIRDEMATAKRNRDAIAGVGEIVTALLEANPAAEAAILDKGKTLAGCYKAMEDYARKHKDRDGICYYMPPDRATSVICEYFGIEAGSAKLPQSPAATAPSGREPLGKPNDPFDLDALMGVL